MIISNNQVQKVLQAYYKTKIEDNKISNKKTEIPIKQEFGSDKVELSKEGREFILAMEAISKTSDVRTKKVDDIKGRIEKGIYSVEGEKVAEKILNRILVDELIW